MTRFVPSRRSFAALALALVAPVAGGACSSDVSRQLTLERSSAASPAAGAAAAAVTEAPATTRPAVPSTEVPQPSTTLPRTRRDVVDQPFLPFATVAGITLVHPATRVERVGFHQSNHEGAQEMVTAASAANPVTLESRERLAAAQSAADVVVDPTASIHAPVTGRVKRAGTYVLYCKHRDDYVVIEPDDRPGWEVKILHINGEQVSPGQRVVAGETLLAPSATQLPFESQVDELRTADPAWPHVHIEVVDPAIRNIPSPGGGCS